jgi:hypothetical protein
MGVYGAVRARNKPRIAEGFPAIEDIVGLVVGIPANAGYKGQPLVEVEGVLDVKGRNGRPQGILLLLALGEAAHGSFEEVELSIANLGYARFGLSQVRVLLPYGP